MSKNNNEKKTLKIEQNECRQWEKTNQNAYYKQIKRSVHKQIVGNVCEAEIEWAKSLCMPTRNRISNWVKSLCLFISDGVVVFLVVHLRAPMFIVKSFGLLFLGISRHQHMHVHVHPYGFVGSFLMLMLRSLNLFAIFFNGFWKTS